MHHAETSHGTLRASGFPSWLIAPSVFALLTVGMFVDVLFSASRVLSHSSTDLALQFIPWRHFGFSQLTAGNLALWNPHIYGGTPYFAGFQSALLYPPNWLHLVLPLPIAINWIIALHVFAAGYFTYLWCRFRGVSIGGSILAGMMFMFGGPYFLHIYAGHLPHLCVMVWAPLILLAIDGLARNGSSKWMFWGALAVAVQIFAGHPQYVYYTAIATGLYAGLLLIRSTHRLQLAGGFAFIWIAGAAIAAIQLLPGLEATGESVRGPGTSYEFASTFSLPPVNFLTLAAPSFFGWVPVAEGQTLPASYWAAGYLWEMCLFAGFTGLILGVYAIFAAPRGQILVPLVMIALLLLLALGRHTPLYRLMFDYVPYYGSFRGTVKFAYLAVLFMALLAGIGFDALWRAQSRSASWTLDGAVATVAVAMLLVGWWITASATSEEGGAWASWLKSLASNSSEAKELFAHRLEQYGEREFITTTAAQASRALWWSALTGAAIVCILLAARFRQVALFGLILLAGTELAVFARASRATILHRLGFPADTRPDVQRVYDAWDRALRELPPNQRALSVMPQYSNLAMSMGHLQLWGYDPLVLRRYAELMATSQGVDPNQASQYLSFRQSRRGLLQMLRCGLVLVPDPRQPVVHVPDPLPVATLVGYWTVLPARDEALSYLLRDDFDPRFAVVLEDDPGIALSEASASGGSVEIIASTTDDLELRARLSRPAILLITNNYARGWRARSLAPSAPQPEYRIMPANYALQAIPLRAGEHHLRIEYAPTSFRIGSWITVLAVLLTVAGAVLVWFKGPKI